MSGSLNGLAHQLIGDDFIAAAAEVSVDDTADGTVILAASAAPGMYEIDASDGVVYARQSAAGTAITVAASRRIAEGVAQNIHKYPDLEIRAITSAGTVVVRVSKKQTPQD